MLIGFLMKKFCGSALSSIGEGSQSALHRFIHHSDSVRPAQAGFVADQREALQARF
jgi:hypothetical protein